MQVHDPVAEANVKAQYSQRTGGDKLVYGEHHYDAAKGADLLCICTEWNEFRNPDFEYLKHAMAAPVILDGRNLYDPAEMAERGFTYEGIGLSAERRRPLRFRVSTSSSTLHFLARTRG